MDFFASDTFLTALAQEYYRAKKFEFKIYDFHGKKLRLVEIDGKKPAVSGPFYDYVKPLSISTASSQTISFVPKLVTSTISLDDHDPVANAPTTKQEPAPLISWDKFETWEDYEALIQKRSGRLLSGQRRRLKKLIEEHGEPVFQFDDHSLEAFDLCILWKTEQYEGGNETLENPHAVAMLRRLFESRDLILSTLKIGDRYLGVRAGFRWQKRYLALIPAYDPFFAKYGIGKELLHRTLEHSYRQGDECFDLLQGGESYKWDYATDVQIIEAAGPQPTLHRIRSGAEQVIKSELIRISPGLFYRLKRIVLTARKVASTMQRRLDHLRNKGLLAR